jgi:hypothetical protein
MQQVGRGSLIGKPPQVAVELDMLWQSEVRRGK